MAAPFIHAVLTAILGTLATSEDMFFWFSDTARKCEHKG